MNTRASIEHDVENAVSKFHKEQQGRAPTAIRADLLRDTIYVRSSGAFTPTEQHLAMTEEGKTLVRSSRRELRALTRSVIEREVAKATGLNVIRSFWDMDLCIGEQLEAFVLSENLEEKLSK